MAEEKTTDKKPDKKPKNNTMELTLINSASNKITASGPCSDKEIKSICKALSHNTGQKIEIN